MIFAHLVKSRGFKSFQTPALKVFQSALGKAFVLAFCLLKYSAFAESQIKGERSRLKYSAFAESRLEAEWSHYGSPPQDLKHQLKDHWLMRWDTSLGFDIYAVGFDSKIYSEYFPDKSRLFYFNIPELYFSYQYKLTKPFYSVEHLKFYVGRKAKDWSVSDDYWDLGIWNTLNQWNPLYPVKNGLIGSFAAIEARHWSADFFVSLFHWPNLESPVFKEDGKVRSSSRWFVPLPNRVRMPNGSYINLDISTAPPSLTKIMFQPAWLFSLKARAIKWKDFHSWIKGSFADKPVNHLIFAKQRGKIFQVREDGVNVLQPLTAFRVRQTVFSVEWGLDYMDFSSVFTVEHSHKKEADVQKQDWVFVNQRENLTYLSLLLGYSLPYMLAGDFLNKNSVKLGWIQSWFKYYNPIANGEDKGPPPAVLSKYPVLNGLRLDWRSEIQLRGQKKAVFDMNYRFSFDNNKGHWLALKALYYISPLIYSRFTVDILASDNNQEQFLGRFRHNDYVSWSLGWLF